MLRHPSALQKHMFLNLIFLKGEYITEGFKYARMKFINLREERPDMKYYSSKGAMSKKMRMSDGPTCDAVAIVARQRICTYIHTSIKCRHAFRCYRIEKKITAPIFIIA
jgi:hypothetical protein